MSPVDPWFGLDNLPSSNYEYVLWMDLMGTSEILNWKIMAGAINIGKLQTKVIESDHSEKFNIYPMMDGIYVTSPDEDALGEFAGDVYHDFSHILTNRYWGYQDAKLKYAPILRTGVAYGEVFHGYELEGTELAEHEIADSILIGDAVVTAHRCERDAPPFEIRVDSSASNESNPINLDWWPSDSRAEEILEAYEAYLDKFEGDSISAYSDDKITEHRKQAREYFQ